MTMNWWNALSSVMLARGSHGGFTLNALVNITAASPPDICAFGDYLSSSSGKPIHLLLIGAPQDFDNLLYFCRDGHERNTVFNFTHPHHNQRNPLQCQN